MGRDKVSSKEDGVMTALRRRMMEDMHLAGLSEATQKRYVIAVRYLATVYRRSPDRITEEEVRHYILQLRDGLSMARGTFATHWHGLKFFYVNTLGVDWPLFVKKKWANPARSVSPTRGPTRNAAVCWGR